MVKRYVIGLFAVGLVLIFMAEAANAWPTSRLRRSVENLHACLGEPCEDATSVTDRLYGLSVYGDAICQMTGRLFCIPLDNGQICSDADSLTNLATASFSEKATFVADSVENLTVLDDTSGQNACDYYYTEPGPPYPTDFYKFWPNQFMAHTIYEFDGGDRDGDPPYELIEKCFIQNDDPEYDCEAIWTSASTGSRPHLPCCGVTADIPNTITVDIQGTGDNKVISDDEKINCPDDPDKCTASYDSTQLPSGDGCPPVVLTAIPECGEYGSCYGVTWGGVDGCTDSDQCTVIPTENTTVTATFKALYHTLKVEMINNDKNDIVYIVSPDNIDFDYPDSAIGQTQCDFKDGGEDAVCTAQIDEEIWVVLKKKGDNIEWGGDCSGVPNSIDTCKVLMDRSRIVKVTFSPNELE